MPKGVVVTKDNFSSKTVQPNTLEIIKPSMGVTIKGNLASLKGPEVKYNTMSRAEYKNKYKSDASDIDLEHEHEHDDKDFNVKDKNKGKNKSLIFDEIDSVKSKSVRITSK